jgi:hypothetical protein
LTRRLLHTRHGHDNRIEDGEIGNVGQGIGELEQELRSHNAYASRNVPGLSTKPIRLRGLR